MPEKLDVVIKTSGLKLCFISLNELTDELVIDFNALKTNAKSQAYSISNGNFNLKNIINFNVDIVKIRPDTLFFSLNKGKTKLVPVKANFKAEYTDGYSIVSKPTITPAFVTVTGDSTELNLLDTIYTQPLQLKNVNQNYSGELTLKKSSSGINYSIKEVKLEFNVDKLTEATLKIPIDILGKPSSETIKLLPKYVTVTYLVAMNDYDNVTSESFRAVVNYSDIESKQKMLPVKLAVTPSDVKILHIQPSIISYLIYR